MKQFKARIEPKTSVHAIEIWLEAENIYNAMNNVVITVCHSMGYDTDDITQLIEIDRKP